MCLSRYKNACEKINIIIVYYNAKLTFRLMNRLMSRSTGKVYSAIRECGDEVFVICCSTYHTQECML